MTEINTYNGWCNYPTWAVNMWLSNDEGLYHYTNDAVRDAGSKYDAAKAIESIVDELVPDLEGFPADLMGWATGWVDYDELAEHWVDDLDIKCDDDGDYVDEDGADDE